MTTFYLEFLIYKSKNLWNFHSRGLHTCARRFELPTPWSVAKCSIQLSYAHIFYCRGIPRMPATGIEPVLYFYNRILSPARLPVPPRRLVISSGTNRARTYDPLLVRQMLSQLSYDPILTTPAGLEPATSAVTGRRSNQLSHEALFFFNGPSGTRTQDRPVMSRLL